MKTIENKFEDMIEGIINPILDNEVKDEFYWSEWYNGTLFINGMSQDAMERVRARIMEVLGLEKSEVRLNRCGNTDEYAFDFC